MGYAIAYGFCAAVALLTLSVIARVAWELFLFIWARL